MTDRPGPGGPWPLDPQVPPYEQPPATPSYVVPSQPYSPPQRPTYPTQAPSFVPAGQYYPAQPYQGQPYQGQPYAGQPYAPQPPGSQPPFQLGPDRSEPDRVPVKYGVMAVVAVVLVAVIGVGVVVWSMTSTPRSTAASVWTAVPTATATARTVPSVTISTASAPTTKPTATSTSTTPACNSGETIVTAVWTATVPSGWTCITGSASSATQLGLVDARREIIVLGVVTSKDAATACGADLANQMTSVVAQPDTVWGGKVAKTATVSAMGLEEEDRCVESNGLVYRLMGDLPEGTQASVIAALDALTSSWVWK